MYVKTLLTSILFSISLIPSITPAAHALGCVNTDISNQLKITGSKAAPGAQKNTVHQAIDPSCVGNASNHQSTQVYVGADGADQRRTSSQSSAGSGYNGLIPSNVGNVIFHVNTPTSVYSPPLDPKFMPKR
jgi:hypothetical protein